MYYTIVPSCEATPDKGKVTDQDVLRDGKGNFTMVMYVCATQMMAKATNPKPSIQRE